MSPTHVAKMLFFHLMPRDLPLNLRPWCRSPLRFSGSPYKSNIPLREPMENVVIWYEHSSHPAVIGDFIYQWLEVFIDLDCDFPFWLIDIDLLISLSQFIDSRCVTASLPRGYGNVAWKNMTGAVESRFVCIYIYIYIHTIIWRIWTHSNVKITDISKRTHRRSAFRCCSNYIFILELTSGFNELGKDNHKTRRETFKFWDLVCLRDLTVRRFSSLSLSHWFAAQYECFEMFKTFADFQRIWAYSYCVVLRCNIVSIRVSSYVYTLLSIHRGFALACFAGLVRFNTV